MPIVTGTGNTFNLPNYSGELFTADAVNTPFLTMIGGLTEGGSTTQNSEFPTASEYDFPVATQPAISEQDSLTAPTATALARTQEKNVVQIFHEAVSISYAKMSNRGRLSGINSARQANNVVSEKDWQIARKLEIIARNVEHSFLNGKFQAATAANVANKTRGMFELAQLAGNEVPGGGKKLTKTVMDKVLRTMADSGAFFRNAVIFANSFQKQMLSEIYGYAPTDRNIGGVNVKQIETDFGLLGIVWDRFVPADAVGIFEMSVIEPVFQPVPDKGFLFYEELSKTGAAETGQIYGQIGLGHGPGFAHGSITGLAAS